jgi:hypothetical protein
LVVVEVKEDEVREVVQVRDGRYLVVLVVQEPDATFVL